MAIVNKINFQIRLTYIAKDCQMSYRHDNQLNWKLWWVLVVFDRCDPHSLKNNAKCNRTKGLSAVHYKVSDTTKIYL